MSDELYDYFGGNASKKVEPIEDDDFDNETEEEVVSEEVVEIADKPTEKLSEDAKEVVASAASGKKSGHWDFLANMLGISSSKKATNEIESTPVSDAAKEDENEEEAGMFGLAPIPSPEKASVVSSMFTPGNDTVPDAAGVDAAGVDGASVDEPGDDLIGWNPRPRKSFIADVEESSAEPSSIASNATDASNEEVEVIYEEGYDDVEVSDGDEVFEFEIEELDPRPRTDESDATHGRRRRKPTRSENSSESQRSSSRRGEPREKISSKSDTDARTSIKPSRTEEKDRDESKSEKPRRARRSRRGSRSGSRQEASSDQRTEPTSEASSKRQVRNESKEGFGAGLEDWDHDNNNAPVASGSKRDNVAEADRSETDNSESRPSGRRRRRRRGGSKTRSERSERTAEQASENSGRGQKDGFGEGILDDGAHGSDLASTSGDDVVERKDRSRESRSVEGDGRSRRRGRTRRRKPANQSEGRSDEMVADLDARDEDDRLDSSSDRGEPTRKRAKVPTWEETISVLVESNIQNHKKSGGGRRGNGGGRGRGGSGVSRGSGRSSEGSSRGNNRSREDGTRGSGRNDGGRNRR